MGSRLSLLLALGVVTAPAPIDAQLRPIRSADYLSVAGVSDVRATWVNPAGLAAIPEASLILEFTGSRSPTGEYSLEQFALGFNSRGTSITYLRNRFGEGNPSTTMLRIATGLPTKRGAFGFAVTLYGAPGENDRDLDLGFMYALNPVLTTAATVQHIGRPTINVQTLPLVFSGGALLSLGGGAFQFSADAIASERLGTSLQEYDMTYRVGTSLTLPLPRPVQLLASVELASNTRIDRLHLGIGVGGRSQIIGLGTGVSRNNTPTLSRMSLTGITSNVITGR